jgi:hypothetical protein
MRSSAEDPRGVGGGVGRRARLLAAAMLAAGAGLAAQAGAAWAEDVTFTLDDGRINLGELQGLPIVDPTVPDPPATLTLDVDPGSGDFTAQPADFVFPSKTLRNLAGPLGLTLDAEAEFSALGELAGNFDATTGVLTVNQLDVSVLITVYQAPKEFNPQLGSCRVGTEEEPVPLPLATAGEIVDNTDPENPIAYEAEPFTPEGAAVATWEQLPAATVVSDPTTLVCPAVDDLLEGEGGIWLAGTTEEPVIDTDGDGVPDDQDACPLEFGPPGNDGCPLPTPSDADGDGVPDTVDRCPTQPGPAANDGCPLPAGLALTVTPRSQVTDPGRAKTFRARVRNSGPVAATGVWVCVTASSAIKGRRCRRIGALGGGATETRRFRLRPTGRAAGKRYALKLRATAADAGAARATAFLKVRRMGASVNEQLRRLTRQVRAVGRQLRKLRTRITSIEPRPGPAGSPGPEGPAGPEGPGGPQGPAAPPCEGNPDDVMVQIGSLCIDRYEASIWDAPTGGNQLTGTAQPPCNRDGHDCHDIYARSVPGVLPRISLTWFQMQRALANSGKRLATNAEWQLAVAGTPDSDDCNVTFEFGPQPTGTFPDCVSAWGANDMVGNVFENVADWVPYITTTLVGWGTFSDDQMGISGASTTGQQGPGMLTRGGTAGWGVNAGPFMISGNTRPQLTSSNQGFRGVRHVDGP